MMTVVDPAELRRRQRRLRLEAEVLRLAAECLRGAEDPDDPPGYLLGIAHAKTEAALLIDELLEPALKNSPEGQRK